jgi:hypothetical protein
MASLLELPDLSSLIALQFSPLSAVLQKITDAINTLQNDQNALASGMRASTSTLDDIVGRLNGMDVTIGETNRRVSANETSCNAVAAGFQELKNFVEQNAHLHDSSSENSGENAEDSRNNTDSTALHHSSNDVSSNRNAMASNDTIERKQEEKESSNSSQKHEVDYGPLYDALAEDVRAMRAELKAVRAGLSSMNTVPSTSSASQNSGKKSDSSETQNVLQGQVVNQAMQIEELKDKLGLLEAAIAAQQKEMREAVQANQDRASVQYQDVLLGYGQLTLFVEQQQAANAQIADQIDSLQAAVRGIEDAVVQAAEMAQSSRDLPPNPSASSAAHDDGTSNESERAIAELVTAGNSSGSSDSKSRTGGTVVVHGDVSGESGLSSNELSTSHGDTDSGATRGGNYGGNSSYVFCGYFSTRCPCLFSRQDAGFSFQAYANLFLMCCSYRTLDELQSDHDALAKRVRAAEGTIMVLEKTYHLLNGKVGTVSGQISHFIQLQKDQERDNERSTSPKGSSQQAELNDLKDRTAIIVAELESLRKDKGNAEDVAMIHNIANQLQHGLNIVQTQLFTLMRHPNLQSVMPHARDANAGNGQQSATANANGYVMIPLSISLCVFFSVRLLMFVNFVYSKAR